MISQFFKVQMSRTMFLKLQLLLQSYILFTPSASLFSFHIQNMSICIYHCNILAFWIIINPMLDLLLTNAFLNSENLLNGHASSVS